MKVLIKKQITFSFFLILILSSKIFSQTNSIIAFSNDKLNEEEERVKKVYLQNEHYFNFNQINLNSLIKNEFYGKVKIDLNDLLIDENLIFSAKRVEYKDENNYIWYGEIKSKGEKFVKEGKLLMISNKGRKFGQINIGNRIFEYFSLSSDKQILYEIDFNKFKGGELECGNYLDKIETSLKNLQLARVDPCADKNVRVLILYTNSAFNADPNIQDRAILALQQTNTAYFNSLVNFKVEYSNVLPLTSFNETNFISNDINSLVNNATAASLRNSESADIVILLTNGNYGQTFGIVAGIGPNEPRAYGIVQVNAATGPRLTFAHEVGHLFGCRHNSDPAGTFEHGYILCTGDGFLSRPKCYYSILGDLPSGRLREYIYSNPDVLHSNGLPFGDGSSNNARQLTEQSTTVANFRNSSFNFEASIELTFERYGCLPLSAEAVVKCGNGPYQYIWEESYGGVFYSPIASTSEIIQIGGGCFSTFDPLADYYLRLTVTDGAGNVAIAYSFAPLLNSIYMPFRSIAQQNDLVVNEIYPNPSNGISNINVSSPKSDKCNLSIFDIHGNIKFEKKEINLKDGKNQIQLSLINFSSGNYFLRIQSSSGVTTKLLKIIK